MSTGNPQSNKGMLKEYARNTAAMIKEYRVYSWWQGTWLLVDHGPDAAKMAWSAAEREAFVTAPLPANSRARARFGDQPINPAGRFVVCAPGEYPAGVPGA